MKTYYVVALIQAPGFKGKLPFLYNATYKSKGKAELAKEEFREQYPKFTYAVVPLDLPVHAGDNQDIKPKEKV